jgi:type III secretion system YscQ/HrcQ family protein
MGTHHILTEPAKRAAFDGLRRYARADVELINWFRRVFQWSPHSKTWFEDAFAQWLEIHKGTAIRLLVTNEIERAETKSYRFEKDEVRIGRRSESEIVLRVPALGKNHARIFEENGNYFLEDCGSAIGTYLNERKLISGRPELLSDGDGFLIFPYRFAVELEEVWIQDDYLEFSNIAVVATKRSQFQAAIPAGFCSFEIGIHPEAGDAVVAVSCSFLETIVSGLTRAPINPVLESDYGIFEFLVTSVVERVNRELAFPLQAAVRKSAFPQSAEQRGLKVEFVLALRQMAGIFCLFLPETALTNMQRSLRATAPPPAACAIRWQLLVCAGRIQLGLSEFYDLGSGDILLFAEDIEILLPLCRALRGWARGWNGRQLGRDPFRIQAGRYFERNVSMNNEEMSGPNSQDASAENRMKPDFGTLPVVLQIVLGQIELSLTELNALANGSILELDRTKDDPVQLAANGKIIGVGSLVEVEGKLGVEITTWSSA